MDKEKKFFLLGEDHARCSQDHNQGPLTFPYKCSEILLKEIHVYTCGGISLPHKNNPTLRNLGYDNFCTMLETLD